MKKIVMGLAAGLVILAAILYFAGVFDARAGDEQAGKWNRAGRRDRGGEGVHVLPEVSKESPYVPEVSGGDFSSEGDVTGDTEYMEPVQSVDTDIQEQ